jgi:hypothetical protein
MTKGMFGLRCLKQKCLKLFKTTTRHLCLVPCLKLERTLMSPRGGVNGRDDQLQFFVPENMSSQCPPVRPVVVTGQTCRALAS